MPNRVLLIDDHRLFSDGLRALLNEQADLVVCGQVFSAGEVLRAIDHHRPDLILLDVNLQGTNGIDMGQQIRATFPAVRVIILTMYNQPKLIDEARRVGLHGYLLKDASTAELLTGIHAVLAGQPFFAPLQGLIGATNADFGDDFARRLNLTFREVEVVRLIRDGLTTEQIAEQLMLSTETIKTHRKNVYFKLGITNVAELVRFVSSAGL